MVVYTTTFFALIYTAFIQLNRQHAFIHSFIHSSFSAGALYPPRVVSPQTGRMSFFFKK